MHKTPQINTALYATQAASIPETFVLANQVTTDQNPNLVVFNPGARTYHTVQVDATASNFSVQIKGSLDNINFYLINVAITAAGVVSFTGPYSAIRADVTAVTGGYVTVTIRSQR